MLPLQSQMYTHTHVDQCSVHYDIQQRNGAAEHFLIIMRQPAVLAGAREEERRGESTGLTWANKCTHTTYTDIAPVHASEADSSC